MSTSPANMPLPARCALEIFGSSGDRTKARLQDLLDHFFRVYAMSDDPDRMEIYESAFTYARRRYLLGESEGF